jgi:hypothetical protein
MKISLLIDGDELLVSVNDGQDVYAVGTAKELATELAANNLTLSAEQAETARVFFAPKIDDSVRLAFNQWMRANRWTSTLTASEKGKLGAARRELNRVLRRRGLTYNEVAPILAAE